ncbi:hypothetical protein C1646_776894 [Rhizophagus diaphanus]|nr:hypothetical protein C1646_776894 [Rhizophagus diaphanus] [Rhizophagus sp. MUCL 43196]
MDGKPQRYRSQIGFQSITADTKDKFKSFGEDVHKAIDELIIKHKLINVSGKSIIHLQQIGFDYKENQVCIKFKDSDPMAIQTRLDAIINVKIFNIDQDINQINDHDNDVYTGDILVNNYEVGNEAYCSLSILLKVLIPV